jgi:DSF synthase
MSTIRFANELSLQNFRQLRVTVDPQAATVWLTMRPKPRPCFTPELLAEIRQYQSMLVQHGGRLPWNRTLVPIEYQVLTSEDPAIFNLGGDLERFVQCIQTGNSDWLRRYAHSCIDVLHPNLVGYGLPITTLSLVRGEALGGGFEAALSSQIIIAVRGAQMGLPEILFNLFPGMGAYHMLSQRLTPAQAERMILSGRIHSAEELFELGIVDALADPGEGADVVVSHVRGLRKRRNAHLAMQRVRALVHPVTHADLMRVCDLWVEAAMQLSERDLRTMLRLVRGQNRIAPATEAVPLREAM